MCVCVSLSPPPFISTVCLNQDPKKAYTQQFIARSLTSHLTYRFSLRLFSPLSFIYCLFCTFTMY